MFSRTTPAFERFPYDILREIMHYTYVYKLELSEEAEINIEVRSLPVPASHVCNSWRRALLSDPTMWTCIVFPAMCPEWIMELLRRSDSSLLNVFLSIEQSMKYKSYDETSSVLSALFKQIHRFKILRAQIEFWYRRPLPPPRESVEVLAQQAVSYLQQPAPKLQMLSFWYQYLDCDTDSSPDYTVIKNLFSGDAPMLKRLHHRLSRDFEELGSLVFRDLSELRLTLVFDLNFDHFLDLLALSPRLKLLLLREAEADNVLPCSSDRKVGLPFLEKLVLEANSTIGLTGFVLKHITLPSSTQWHIACLYYPDLQSPSVSQFLSRAHFTSLRIRASPSDTRLTLQKKLNDNHINSFVVTTLVLEEDIVEEDWMDLCDPVMQVASLLERTSSFITHMELEIGGFSGSHDIFPTFFTSMSGLKSLVIRPDFTFLHASGIDEVRFLCLAALLPNFQDLLTKALDNKDTWIAADVIQNPDHNYKPPIATTLLPCPLLREITVELRDPLETNIICLLWAFSRFRRDAGYPSQIHVRCSQVEQDVEEFLEKLEILGNDSIKISVLPLYAV